jgi:hypothetical protein
MGPSKAKKKKAPTKPRETLVAKNRRLDRERGEKMARGNREQEALFGVNPKEIKERAPKPSNTGGSRRSSQTTGDKDRIAAASKRNQNRAAASRKRTDSGKNPVSAFPGPGAAKSPTKPAKTSGSGSGPGKAPEKKGFFGKLGDNFKKATTLTPGRPRKPSGKKPMRTPSTGPWAKYEKDMKAFRKKQEASKAKAGGGRVTAKKPMAKKPTAKKPMARTSVKKRMPRRP